MPYITEIYAREILDSRGIPTIETEVWTESGSYGKAIVPMDKVYRVQAEVRDKDSKKYLGLSVSKQVENINSIISKSLIGEDVRDQIKIDRKLIKMDSTVQRSKLGGTAIYSLSIAISKAASQYSKLSYDRYLGGNDITYIPTPIVEMIKTSNKSSLIESVSILPVSDNTFKDSIRMAAELSYTLENVLKEKEISYSLNQTGSIDAGLSDLELINVVIDVSNKLGLRSGVNFLISLTINASRFYKVEDKKYVIENKTYDQDEYIQYLDKMIKKVQPKIIIDPSANGDYETMRKIVKKYKDKIMVVGDSYFDSSYQRIDKSLKNEFVSGVVIRPSLVGTITETNEIFSMIKEQGACPIIGLMDGETTDDFVSYYSASKAIKLVAFGGLRGLERITKYNAFTRIEDDLNGSSKYVQKKF